LVARDGAWLMRVGVLSPGDAVTLLTGIVGATRVGLEPHTATTLAELCGHLPLALRIVAAKLALNPMATIADQVRAIAGADRLDRLQVAGDPQNAVRAVIDQSYQALSTDDQRLFRLLGLVPGPDFTAAAAAALAGITPEEARNAIDRLDEAHLVASDVRGRFHMHDLIRIYANEQAHGHEPDPDAALHRLCAFYLDHVDAAATVLYPNTLRLHQGAESTAAFPDRAAALAWLDAEVRCLIDAIRHNAERGSPEMAWRLADSLRGYLGLRGRWVDWLTAARAARSAAVAARDDRAQAAAHINLGMVTRAMGDHVRAAAHYRTALTLAEATGWHQGQARILTTLSGIAIDLGQLQRAARHGQRAVELTRELHDRIGTLVGLINLGRIYNRIGQLHRAADQLTEAVGEARKLGSRDLLSVALHNLGYTYYLLGELTDAEHVLDETRHWYAEVGADSRVALVDANLAMIYSDTGRLDMALPLAHRVSATLSDLNRPLDLVYALNTLGLVETAAGRHDDAERHLTRGLELGARLGASGPEITAHLGLADLHHVAGQTSRAAEHAERALELARRTQHHTFAGQALTTLAEISVSTSHREQALEYARQALAKQLKTGHRPGELRTRAVLTDLQGSAVSSTGPTATLSGRVR
ncbi:MAG TPA: tetratricopeptide repeat protein, partial [Reyranella sp.]|nr:tetratricopeptide repeat protein [Reyranella sp.]